MKRNQRRATRPAALVYSNGVIDRDSLAYASTIVGRLVPSKRPVKRKKLFSGQVLPLDRGGLNHGLPRAGGDSPALTPLPYAPHGGSDIGSEFGGGIPEIKNVVDAIHGDIMTRDSLSRQGGTTLGVTTLRPRGTLGPMSAKPLQHAKPAAKPASKAVARSTTPAKYRKEFHERLKAARKVARLSQPEAASKLGLKDRDAYAKYETRSLPPHHLIVMICDAFNVDCDYLLRGRARHESKASSSQRE